MPVAAGPGPMEERVQVAVGWVVEMEPSQSGGEKHSLLLGSPQKGMQYDISIERKMAVAGTSGQSLPAPLDFGICIEHCFQFSCFVNGFSEPIASR
jgi:hypothetical protein